MRSWSMDEVPAVHTSLVPEAGEAVEFDHAEIEPIDVDPVDLVPTEEEELPCEPSGDADGETLLKLGLMYAIGRLVPLDLVAAHKWLNLAAMRGNREAARLRLEIASDMSPVEIAAAQRAARDWLVAH